MKISGIVRKIIYIAAAVLIVAVDQITKVIAGNVFKEDSVSVIKNVFYFVYTENTGAAFSMFSGKKWLLIGFVSIVMAVMLYLLISDRIKNKLFEAGLWMAVAGGIGNLIDRILKGYVVDFIYFSPINFPVFNVADIFITVGAGILLLSLILDIAKEKNKNTAKSE